MHLSLMPVTLAGATPAQVVAVAARAGYDSVGITLWGRDGAADALLDAGAMRELQAQLRDSGIPLLAVEAICLEADFDIAKIKPLLDATAALGSLYLNVYGDDPDALRMAENLARLARGARQRGVSIALEFISRMTLRTLGDAVRMMDLAATPGIELVFDPLHLHRSGGTPEELRAVDPADVAYGQICDAPFDRPAPEQYLFEGRTNRLYPGSGGLPLDAFMDALPPGKPLGVEVPNLETAGLTLDERARLALSRTKLYLQQREAAARAIQAPGLAQK